MVFNNLQINWLRIFLKSILGAILLLIGISSLKPPQNVPAAPSQDFEVFLPLLFKPEDNKTLLGLYPDSYWKPDGLSGALEAELDAIGSWSGKQVALAGVFHSIDQHDDFIIDDMFATIWNAGYTPFVNIYFTVSASSIASGAKDADIRAWAQEYKRYANGGSRMAFLAPMQEMNGNWVPYGSSDPAFYKAAYQRVRQIFDAEGVPSTSIKWVFAPNGHSSIGWPEFEAYYPGDDLVDVIGFSSYNYGYHSQNPYKKWETPDELFTPFIDRINLMAPGKPIIVAQTGTTGYGPNGYSISLKNQWLDDAYTLLSDHGVFGVMYYSANNVYDWAFYRYNDSDFRFEGYRDGIVYPEYQYMTPNEVMSLFP